MTKTYGPSMLGAAFLLLAFLTASARAEVGVTNDKIVFGIVNDQSGQIKNLGLELTRGIMVAFEKANAAGGIHGRRIEARIRDDKYDPQSAAQQSRELIEKDGVFALVGSVGTPTAKASLPFIEKKQVPFLMPLSGADFLRTPFNPLIFPLRASYEDEGEALVHQLVDVEKIKEIALFTQSDSYGDAAKQAVYRALAKRGLKGAGEGLYVRGTLDIEPALSKIMAAKPKAVIVYGSLKPAVAFLARAAELHFTPIFAGVSVLNYTDLVREAGATANGMIFSDSIPLPSDTSLPIVREYRADLKASTHEHFTAASLEGYMAGLLVVEALRRNGPDLSRASLRKTLEAMGTLDFHGVTIDYRPTLHQGLSHVNLFRINNGKIEKF